MEEQKTRVKLLLVRHTHQSSVSEVPEVSYWLKEGWEIHKVESRVTVAGFRYLIVLSKSRQLSKGSQQSEALQMPPTAQPFQIPGELDIIPTRPSR